ncbi:MAG: substrate-binding domain-containing protein [Pseudomonadota bacterium]
MIKRAKADVNAVIRFVTPVALLDVITSIGSEFERSTGYRLDLSIMLNPEVPGFIRSGAPWSIAASNPWHLEEIAHDARGPIRTIGRSPLAFGARGEGEGGAAVGDEAGISEVLRRSKRIGVTGAGTSGGTFARLLDRLKLTDDMRDKVIPMKGGEPMRQLIAGGVDLAVLPLTNIAPIQGVHSVVICPWELEVHVDLALCCHPKACAGASLLASWLMSNERNTQLQALGLMRF